MPFFNYIGFIFNRFAEFPNKNIKSILKFLKVCVSTCPDRVISGFALATQGQNELAKSMMKPFCEPMTSERWNRKSALELIKQGKY